MGRETSYISTQEVQRKTGLLGKKGILIIKDKNLVDDYPFAPSLSVPVEVLSETSYFLVCKVLPHKNESPMAFGIGREYTITVDKFNLVTKKMEIVPN